MIIRKYALKKNIVDIPNERSSHTSITPRGGGLAIIISWYIGIVFLFYANKIEDNLFFALLSGIVLAVVSLIDDIKNLTPSTRLITQGFSSFALLFFLGGFHLSPELNSPILFWITNTIVFIGIIWFVNLYNFLDGIDAYASQEAILIASGMFITTSNPIFIILIISVGGFIFWNWPTAKIFMGDVGSTQLGFILITLGIYLHNSAQLSFGNWLILTSIFWFDATITLYRRWRNNEQLSKAHKKHLFQRINQSGYSHLKINLFSIIINIFLIILVWFNVNLFHNNIMVLTFVIIGLFIIMNFIEKKINFNGETLQKKIESE